MTATHENCPLAASQMLQAFKPLRNLKCFAFHAPRGQENCPAPLNSVELSRRHACANHIIKHAEQASTVSFPASGGVEV